MENILCETNTNEERIPLIEEHQILGLCNKSNTLMLEISDKNKVLEILNRSDISDGNGGYRRGTAFP